jgi:hypothetical protein
VTLDEELNQLDDNVRRLKIEYDIFFGGGSKKPPTDLEWRVQATIKRHSDNRKLNFAQRFKFNSITQKYAVFNSLWQQKLRIKEEGYRRPQDALLSIQGLRSFEDDSEVIDISEPEPFRAVFSDAEVGRKQVQSLYEAMMEARKHADVKAPAGSFESFQQFVAKKTDQIRKEYGCSQVEYSIETENGQVRLKAKAKTQ